MAKKTTRPTKHEIKIEKRDATEAVVKAYTEGQKSGSEKESNKIEEIKAKIEEKRQFYRSMGAFEYANGLKHALEIIESAEESE